MTKADSGASRHYLRICDQHILQRLQKATGPTHTSQTHIFKNLHSSSLFLLGQLCDDNCHIALNKNRIKRK